MEHRKLLLNTFSKLNKNDIKDILDAGSGKTSLGILLEYFDDSQIDAVIFPGDERKSSSIKDNVESDRFTLNEYDICSVRVNKAYDLVLAHLLLGEATKWGNKSRALLDKLLNINSRYFIIFDFKEDPSIDYGYLINCIDNSNFELVFKDEIVKQEPQSFSNGSEPFIGKTYVAYLIKNNK